MKVGILTIGNEILLGRTINTNLGFMGKVLAENGLSVFENITVRDEREEILFGLKQLWDRNDIVITTGGLGPTDDDITRGLIAEFFEQKLIFIDEIWDDVVRRFTRRNIEIPECNRSQAMIPEKFDWMYNAHGTAPGLFYYSNNKTFVALPGVPIEMKTLLTEELIPRLKRYYKTKKIHIYEIHTIDISESKIAEMLSHIEVPVNTNLAYLPQAGRVTLRVYGESKESCLGLVETIKDILGSAIWGYNDETLINKLHNKLLERKLTISAAESCTGGLIQSMLTSLSGSSEYYPGGVVTYSNEMKQKFLNVSAKTLKDFGAVSEETALEMSFGLQDLMKTDLAGAVTGIAGPGGGSEEKPVGTVHICVRFGSKLLHKKFILHGNRELVRFKSAERMLWMFLKILENRD